MDKILTETERAEQLKGELYYELLEHHIELKRNMAAYQERIIQLKSHVAALREHAASGYLNSKEIANAHNKQIDIVVGIIRKHGKYNKLALEEIEALKIKQ